MLPSPTSIMPTRKHLVCIEGGIGVGKTTLLRELEHMGLPGVKVVYEPVEEWRSVIVNRESGENLLGAMYSGEISHEAFQLSIMPHRVLKLQAALSDPATEVVVSERSPWSERHVFAKETLAPAAFSAYVWAQNETLLATNVHDCEVSFCLLTLPASVAKKRIEERGRAEEGGVDVDYLEKLNVAHRALFDLDKSEFGLRALPLVHTLDASKRPAELAAWVAKLCAARA